MIKRFILGATIAFFYGYGLATFAIELFGKSVFVIATVLVLSFLGGAYIGKILYDNYEKTR